MSERVRWSIRVKTWQSQSLGRDSTVPCHSLSWRLNANAWVHPQCLTLARWLKVVEEDVTRAADGCARQLLRCRGCCCCCFGELRRTSSQCRLESICICHASSKNASALPHPRQLHTSSEEPLEDMLRSRREGVRDSIRRGIFSMTSMKSRDVMMNTLPFGWS